MALKDRIKIVYKCPEKLWDEMKYLQIVSKEKDTHSWMDKMIRLGIKSFKEKNEKKR